MADALSDAPIKVLVVDDQRVNQRILEVFLSKEGHSVVTANDGAEAIELHRLEQPDLILMDIVMPGIDGLEAARRIGVEAGALRTPIIFLSGLNDEKTVLDGLELGDDFIAKPIDFTILRAKLRAFIRLVQTQRMLRMEQRRVEMYNEAMRSEGEVALFVLGRVLANTEPPDGHSLQYKVVPSSMFSGDLILARRTPSGRLHLLLADAVGHGLPAAINILPLFFPFDGMSRKGFPIAIVARELNRRVRDLLPIDRFVAATLVSIDADAGTIDVWNGGNPPALLIGPDGRVKARVDSMQMALGINDDVPGLFEPSRITCAAGDQLVLFSDGIWENPAFAGDDTTSRVERLLTATPALVRMDALIEAALAAGQSDDLSVVVVTQPEPSMPGAYRAVGASQLPASRFSVHLNAETLRQADIVDSIMVTARALGLVARFPKLPVIFTELFVNALDHGVLDLPSEIKYRSGEGYLEFFEERQRRLDALGDGFIAIEMELDSAEARPILRLMISDSGKGFDPHDHGHAAAADDEMTAGRGLTLVRSLSHHLSYNSQGNEVVVLIDT